MCVSSMACRLNYEDIPAEDRERLFDRAYEIVLSGLPLPFFSETKPTSELAKELVVRMYESRNQ